MRYVEDLKFRLWSTERNHWLAVGMTIIDFQQDASQSLQLPILTSEGGVIVQQFTGLQDIDGNDIYEGDFVELWTVANQKAPNMRGLYEIIWGRTGFDLKCHKTAAGDIWFQLQKDKSFENTDGSYFVPSKIVIDTLPLRGFNICKVVGNICEGINETN